MKIVYFSYNQVWLVDDGTVAKSELKLLAKDREEKSRVPVVIQVRSWLNFSIWEDRYTSL